MSEKLNLEVVKQVYAAFARGDLAAILSVQHPNTEIESAGPQGIPWAGRFLGPEGVRQYFMAIAEQAELEDFQPHTFLAQEDQVIVLGFERVRARRTGRSYGTHWVHAFTLNSGKIAALREYSDTATVAAAFRYQEDAA